MPVGISVSLSNPGEPTRLIGDLNKPDQRILVAQGGYGGTSVTNYLGTPGEARSIVLDLKVFCFGLLIIIAASSYWQTLVSLDSQTQENQVYCKHFLVQRQRSHLIHSLPYVLRLLRLHIPTFEKLQWQTYLVVFYYLLPLIYSYVVNNCFCLGLADIAAKLSTEQHLKEPPPLRHAGFLKHVERTSCLLIVLDALGFQANQCAPMRSPISAAVLLVSQLQRHASGRLLGKPMLCAINKVAFNFNQLLINPQIAAFIPNVIFLPDWFAICRGSSEWSTGDIAEYRLWSDNEG